MATVVNNSINPSIQKVLHLLQQGQMQHAEKQCRTICSEFPHSADALHLLAIIYARSQQYPLANEYFLKAIACSPARADFLGNYANALCEQTRFEEAIPYCQKALTLGNIRPELYNTLGNALFKTGKSQDAIASYRNAIRLQADYPEAYNNLGLALKDQNKLKEAEQCFRKALSFHPDYDLAATHLREVDSSWLEPVCGRRVYLRRYCEQDAGFLQSCYQNMAFMRYYNQFTPTHASLEALTVKLREEEQTHPYQKKSISWMIVQNKTQRPIGLANLVDIQFNHSKAEFLVGIPNQNDRAMSSGIEATLLIMDFAFNFLCLNKLYSLVYGDNLAAQKNIIGMGFIQESFQRQHVRHPETKCFIDLYGNAILEAEFRNNDRLSKLARRLVGRDITDL